MLRILNEEGFNIKERELMRVRAKNRWLLRVPNGMKPEQELQQPNSTTTENGAEQHQHQDAAVAAIGEGELLALHQDTYRDETENNVKALIQQEQPRTQQQGPVGEQGTATTTNPPVKRASSPGLSPEVVAKRKERLERLKTESEERWAARKRRRRTRGWAGLPADPPGPPRFPSETTIDESKQFLTLDSDMYRTIRDHFQRICEESGFIKKTSAGPEKWQTAKDRLIQECPHLQEVFWTDSNQVEAKALALDIVCTDVTKRMRTLERRMTIAEAKNALGINPEESRQIRNAFYNNLKADHFTSKLEAGDDHWKELKQQWVQESAILQQILAPGEDDPEHTTKVKAIEVLCRDVMKRLRDDQTKRDPMRRRSGQSSNAQKSTNKKKNNSNIRNNCDSNPPSFQPDIATFRNGISTLASQALASAPMLASEMGDMQIDPSLLQAANNPAFSLGPEHHVAAAAPETYRYVDTLLDNTAITTPTPIYLRVHPQSQVYQNTKMWLHKLSTRSLDELRQVVGAKFTEASIARIEGAEKTENGQEVSFLIEEDHDVDAYLTHMQGRKATFVFLLNV